MGQYPMQKQRKIQWIQKKAKQKYRQEKRCFLSRELNVAFLFLRENWVGISNTLSNEFREAFFFLIQKYIDLLCISKKMSLGQLSKP